MVDRDIVQETIVTTAFILAGPCVDAIGQEMKPFAFKYKLQIQYTFPVKSLRSCVILMYLFQLSLESV